MDLLSVSVLGGANGDEVAATLLEAIRARLYEFLPWLGATLLAQLLSICLLLGDRELTGL